MVDKADRLEPRWNREWLEYAQARGLVVDPARVRSPQDKGRARADATRVREQDQQRHDAALAAPAAQLAAANDTIAALRDQLTRDQAALDRERAEQHRLTGLLHDIFTSRPAAPASNGGQHPQADDGTGHQPAAAGGNGTSRRHAPPRLPRPPRHGPGTPPGAAAPAPPAHASQP